MPDAVITVWPMPNGPETIRLVGDITSHDTETGWRVQMDLDESCRESQPSQLVGAAAELTLGQRQHRALVTEYQPAEGKIVIEGPGATPA